MQNQNRAIEFQNIVFTALAAKAAQPTTRAHYDSENKNPDIACCFEKQSSVHFLRATTCDMLLSMGFEAKGFADALVSVPQKQIKRATQFLNALDAGDISLADKTSVVLLCTATRFENRLPKTELAYYALTGKGDENTSDLTHGIGFQKLFKTFATTCAGTATTQTSRSQGKNGFFHLLDMTAHDSEGNTVINIGSPLVAKFAQVAEKTLAKVWG
ncbi:hypothetical protein [Chromobacterium sp. ASV23]|uniref:hypothetical protein n=1 Tax=Chromobacterium sp. ASV23 TaxID=2795110 RepID=UPI0018EBC9F8|nr:hypothetical protein [Chromobacterium sp. ASV23]